MASIADFIRSHSAELSQRWLERVQGEHEPGAYTTEILRDHIPELLDRVADCIDAGEPSGPLEEISKHHARVRHEIGFDLRGLVREYHILRTVLLEAINDVPGPVDETQRAAFHAYLDTAITEAVTSYVEERERVRQLFIGILGHDLRGPLNTISLMTQRLLRDQDELEPRQVRRISRVGSALSGMQRMIDELLDFTRGRALEAFPIRREEGDLRDLVEDAVEESRMGHPEREIRFERPDAAVHGHWDFERVEQALANLLSNAIRHGDDPVEVAISPSGDAVRIDVTNRGKVPKDVSTTLFDPFRTTGGTHGGGLGLGLYISREIAHAHGGTVELDTSAEDRTTFTLVLRGQPERAALSDTGS